VHKHLFFREVANDLMYECAIV